MDEPDTPEHLTVADRLRRAGLSEERIREHLARGTIRVDGEPVADLDQPAPWGTTRPVIGPS